MSKILTDARMVPNFENGKPAGYRLQEIQKGSVYEKLGFKNDDVISDAQWRSGRPPRRPRRIVSMATGPGGAANEMAMSAPVRAVENI